MSTSVFNKVSPKTWEFIFHITLIFTVFIFFVFGHRDNQIEAHEIAFFLNYACAAYVINFWLLPQFLYKKKYIYFLVGVLLLLGLVIFIEEGVIEQIYFPDTRAKSFPGIYDNLLSSLPTITILAGFKFGWDALKKERELEQLHSLVQESELEYLKSQINPHFLFNNLNNLYAYALEKSDKTPEIILELSGVLRYMLYECKETFVPLSNEVDQLTNFVNLSKLQFEERGTVSLQVDDTGLGEFQIAPLILSVFIENAFKHSASSQSDNIQISIKLGVDQDGKMNFSCQNTFSSQSNTNSLSKGIGLENVKKRLSILYPDKHTLDISQTNALYSVKLKLDLRT